MKQYCCIISCTVMNLLSEIGIKRCFLIRKIWKYWWPFYPGANVLTHVHHLCQLVTGLVQNRFSRVTPLLHQLKCEILYQVITGADLDISRSISQHLVHKCVHDIRLCDFSQDGCLKWKLWECFLGFCYGSWESDTIQDGYQNRKFPTSTIRGL